MIGVRAAYRRLRALKWISPSGFLINGLTFAGVYAVLHLLGWRQYTSIFCGTLPADRTEQIATSFCGLIYTMLYMLTVLAAPILILAAGMFGLAQRALARSVRPEPSAAPATDEV